jgi:putative NIF3 family GTP cyclohydrolase 1 type 2
MAGADAFITADIKYHTFQEARGKILLIDAGHYETEILSLDELQRRIKTYITTNKIKVYKFNGSANPVNIFNN